MNITSIDNAYEDDGLVQLQSFLIMLNMEQPATRRLIGIVPEYRDGRLDRLNCVTEPIDACTEDMSAESLALEEAGRAVVQHRIAAHDAAVKKLNALPMISVRVAPPAVKETPADHDDWEVCAACGHYQSTHATDGQCHGWMPAGTGHHKSACDCAGFRSRPAPAPPRDEPPLPMGGGRSWHDWYEQLQKRVKDALGPFYDDISPDIGDADAGHVAESVARKLAAAQGWTPPRWKWSAYLMKPATEGAWVKWSDIAHLFQTNKNQETKS